MKKKDAVLRDSDIVAGVKAEMQEPRLTESVRVGEHEQPAKKMPK
jgi:hypothetical protein